MTMTLPTDATLAKARHLDELGVRCHWYTTRGHQCTRYGNNWRLGQGRYCDQHARKAGWQLW